MTLKFKEYYQAVIFRELNDLSPKWKVVGIDKRVWILRKNNSDVFKTNNLKKYQYSNSWFD